MKIYFLLLFYLIAGFCEEKEDWIAHREWPYLTSEALKSRYAIAAYLLRGSPMIIEIGGYKTPISDFILDTKVIVIDPKIIPKKEKKVLHVSLKLQDWDDREINAKPFDLIILGMDLHLDDQGWKKLYKLINLSRKTILEFSMSYKPALEQFKKICENITKKPTLTIKLDLSENDQSGYPEFYPFRKMVCFE